MQASKAEIKSALRAADGDVTLAGQMLSGMGLDTVSASGRRTRELDERKEEVEQRMRAAQTEWDDVTKRQKDLRARKEERTALQRAVQIAAHVEEEVMDISGEGKQEEEDAVMEEGLAELALSILQQNTYDSSYFYPFWMSLESTTETRNGLLYKRNWSSLNDPSIKYHLLGFARDGKMEFQNANGQERRLSAKITFQYGIPITVRTSNLPVLIPSNLKQQYKRAKATDQAMIRTLIDIIPGFNGYFKHGRGRRTTAGRFQLTNITGTIMYFHVAKDTKGTPALFIAQGPRESIPASETALTKITSENVQKILNGYDEFYRSPMNLTGVSKRLAPHIRAAKSLEIDDTAYIGLNATRAEIGRW